MENGWRANQQVGATLTPRTDKYEEEELLDGRERTNAMRVILFLRKGPEARMVEVDAATRSCQCCGKRWETGRLSSLS